MQQSLNKGLKGEKMLLSEKVKDLALIRSADVSFGEGLNIITGETGAGKSLVIGSVELALGGKAKSDIVRRGAEEASVELVFCVDEAGEEALKALDIEMDEDSLVIMTRKIKEGRSVARINGNAVNAGVLKKAASILIDIHGQRDQTGLLQKKNLCRILDRYASDEVSGPLDTIGELYREYRDIVSRIEGDISDPMELKRRQDLLSYEADEIEKAELKSGEDEELEAKYRLMRDSKKIAEALSEALGAVSGEGGANGVSASFLIGTASERLKSVEGLDKKTDELLSEIAEIESLMGDLSMDLGERLRSMEFSDAEFEETEERLDLINKLKSKYGRTIEEIQSELLKKREELLRLSDHEGYMEKLEKQREEVKKSLMEACGRLSGIRRRHADRLQDMMKGALSDLNFENVEFAIEVQPDEESVTSDGYDTVSFMVSLNKGEKLKPLEEVASGGELSRIMLALKTVLADTDDIPTLIFDEIDTGISGRTAEKVAEKLSVLAKKRQVIAITHLPQIAAMADHHFVIEKTSDDESTSTGVRELKGEEPVEELSRLLSGSKITDTVRENAKEMLLLARKFKSGHKCL